VTWHLIGGSKGCAFARENRSRAVVVDALRASATAASLLDHGATELLVVSTVDDAYRARRDLWPDALLYGERGGLPPRDFDFGNRPCMALHAAAKKVIFTTSNGSARLLEADGAVSIHLASTVNALATVEALSESDEDIVLIPAGLVRDDTAEAPEDWAAATAIAMLANAEIGEGALLYRDYRALIELDGVLNLFESAPHAQLLRDLDLAQDIADCARNNVYRAVPTVVQRSDFGLIVRDRDRA